MDSMLEGLYYIGIAIAAGAFVSSAIFAMGVAIVYVLKTLREEDEE